MKRSTRINICLLCKLFWGNREENQPQSLLCIIVPRAIRRLLYFLWAKAAFHSFFLLFCLWKEQSHWFRLRNKISTCSVWAGSMIFSSFHRCHWWQKKKVDGTVSKPRSQCSPVILLKKWRSLFSKQRFQVLNDFSGNKKRSFECFRLPVVKLFFVLRARHVFCLPVAKRTIFNSLFLSIHNPLYCRKVIHFQCIRRGSL